MYNKMLIFTFLFPLNTYFMTAQELIERIKAIPYAGTEFVAARDRFVSMFPLESLENITSEQYQQIGSKQSFCYNLEFVSDLPFRLGRAPKFGNNSDPSYPKMGNIVKMIKAVASGQASNLQNDFNLKDVGAAVLLKILSIYLPTKFIGIANKETLTLLAKILGIKNIPNDIIELNYKCTDALMKLNAGFAEYEFYRLGNAIWELLSPTNKETFKDWLKGNKSKGSGAIGAYVNCVEYLSYFYGINYFHSAVKIDDLQDLLREVKIHQTENNGEYYYKSNSYGKHSYYSAAVADYIRFITQGANSAYTKSTEPEQELANMKKEYPKNIILYGPPGTGKTFNTVRYAVSIIEGLDVAQFESSDVYTDAAGNTVKVKDAFDSYIDSKRICFTTFHQSLAYEDFIEGIKPISENGNISYAVKPGIFKQICQMASDDSMNNYVLIIDEINRGNVASIFGELITLIEDDKRKGQENWVRCKLPYSNEEFSVPSNLYIIGTMNTADRSIEALDSALRRRFDFIEMMPKSHKVATVAQPYFETINKRLRILKDSEHQLGHSYFMKVSSESDLCDVFRNRVIPLIQEYFFGDMDRIRMVLGGAFCVNEKVEDKLFADIRTDIDTPDEVWRLWSDAEWKECVLHPDKFLKELENLKF